MYKIFKKDKNLSSFNKVFLEQILKRKLSNTFVLFLSIISIVACALYLSFFMTNKAQANDTFDVNWSLSPLSMECYVGRNQYGYNQFHMNFNGKNPFNGLSVSGDGVTICTSPNTHEPGRKDIEGKNESDLYVGDSRGVCHCENKGYWAEADGLGYWHYYVWSDKPTPAYQSWNLVDSWFTTPAYGGFLFRKTSTCNWSLNNKNYSLAGCTYFIYLDYQSALNETYACGMLRLNENGIASTAQTFNAERTYYIRESSDLGYHGKNYHANNDIGYVKIEHEKNINVTWPNNSSITYNEPASNSDMYFYTKQDKQLIVPGMTQGDAEFVDAEYEFEYYQDLFTTKNEKDSKSYKPDRTWIMKTDKDACVGLKESYRNNKVSGDSFFEKNGCITCPIGTYLIHEVKAPKGYLLSDKYYIALVLPDESSQTGVLTEYYDADTGVRLDSQYFTSQKLEYVSFEEQVIRGDYKFNKINERNEVMAGIPFKITSVTTNEWHIVVTDNNGQIDTSSNNVPHTFNTNANDALYDESTGKIKDETALDSNCGVWFGYDKFLYVTVQADDSLCALPYDTYTIEEIKTSKNSKYYPFLQRSFVVSNNDYQIDGGTWVNNKNLCLTNAFGISDTQEVYASESETVFDRVNYSGLTDGDIFEVKAWLVDKETGEKIDLQNTDNNENYVKKSFIANSAIGYVDVSASLDTRYYSGKTIVWMVEIYDFGYQNLLCDHKDIIDKSESLYVQMPTISTDLSSNCLDKSLTETRSDIQLTDRVYYQGAKIGQEYILNGTLMDKDCGEAYLNEKNNEQACSQTKIIARETSGYADITYNLDMTACNEPKSLVSFVDIMIGDVSLFSHNNLYEVRQTSNVVIPEFSTKAFTSGNNKTVNLTNDMQVFDCVKYKNMPTNKNLKVYSWFVYKENRNVVCDGSVNLEKANNAMSQFLESLKGDGPVKYPGDDVLKHVMFAEQDLTCDKYDGDFNILFNFNGEKAIEGDIVAFTYILDGDNLIACKEDIDDEDETLRLTSNNQESNNIATKAVKTGDTISQTIILALLFLVCAILWGWFVWKIRRNKWVYYLRF